MAQNALQVEAVVLAAGQGTRMRSKQHKVLHCLGGTPMLHHVLNRAEALGAGAIHVVIGHQAEAIKIATPRELDWVLQTEQLGTGHAVAQVMPHVQDASVVLVLFGDVPMVSQQLLADCVDAAGNDALALVTADFDDPTGLGRIVRDAAGNVLEIVEHKDANEYQLAIREINSGIMALPGALLRRLLKELMAQPPQNNQGEYYLTTLVEYAVRDGIAVRPIKAKRPQEVMGVNTRNQLAELERDLQRQRAEQLMADGVTVADPARLDVRGELTTGIDVFIDVNVVFEGTVSLGSNVRIGPGCVITDSVIGDDTHIFPNTVMEGAEIGIACNVGPFARLRPGTKLSNKVKIGNFVETKNAELGDNSKASHLTYLGDTTVGRDCNIGAGTVTCNYDGINKHRTDMGDGVFVGTNSTLVAPIKLGDNSFVAAGSTLTGDLADEDLGVGRGKQRNIKGWTRPDRRSK